MFCVIQERETRRWSKGEPKSIEVHEEWDGDCGIYSYGWHYSEEAFMRRPKPSYKISIHKSYREDGKVKKRQIPICTIGYYSIIDYGGWIGDYIKNGRLEEKSEILGISEDELVDMVYGKFQPIIDMVLDEYSQTEEYAARRRHTMILEENERRENEFAEMYGAEIEDYRICYDVFGNLRNPEYLEMIKNGCRENSRSYQKNNYGNYGYGNGCSYQENKNSNYKNEEREMMKQFYRVLSKKFHPDANPGEDTSKEMQLLNSLKDEWGV